MTGPPCQGGWATNGVERMFLGSGGLTLNGQLTGTAVTQTPNDSTMGRLMKVGDFGLGNTSGRNIIADLDAFNLPDGNHRTDAATVGTYPAGVSAGSYHLDVSRLNSTIHTQVLTENADACRQWIRRYTGSVWAPWRIMPPVTGTVSQVGGVPTGAIIERGSNGNGDFVRFADGTLICTRMNLSVPNANTALGALFRSGDVAWTYPAAFAAAPIVTGEVDDLDTWLTTGVPTTTAVTLRALAAVTKATALGVRAQAVGRWFI